jgi:hypothetical protein
MTTTTTRNGHVTSTESSRSTKYEAADGSNATLGAFTVHNNGEGEGWTYDGGSFTDLFSWLAAVETLAVGQPTLGI